MGRPKLLMACANYWQSPLQVGSHHLARGFVASGWDVAFISDPISPFHLLQGLRPELRDRFTSHWRGGTTELAGRLWSYVPATLLSPHNKLLLRSEWVHRNWASLSRPNVAEVVRARGFGEVDLLYFDSLNQNFWLDRVVRRRSVFRVADRHSGFRKVTPAMQRLERELATSVDAVVYAAGTLRRYVEDLGARESFHLPNGVDFAHFERLRPKPADLEPCSGPIAIYIGAMDEWFDFALMDAAVERLPQISFVLIGPEHLARSRLRPAPNLHLLGRRPYAQLPAYLQHARVGLIPFDVAGHPELIHNVNPLKLYEYLAAGLPVVAAEWEELAALKSPAHLCRSRDEFVAAIARAVSEPGDRKRYQEYARGAGWENRVKDLIRHLGF
jgi:glycosyltransferase involved in cell wall biosynthesis